MFNKRKENQIGSDIGKLGIECMNYYRLLKKESRRFIEILLMYKEIILNLSAYNSISGLIYVFLDLYVNFWTYHFIFVE